MPHKRPIVIGQGTLATSQKTVSARWFVMRKMKNHLTENATRKIYIYIYIYIYMT
jgi:hypothetical protein